MKNKSLYRKARISNQNYRYTNTGKDRYFISNTKTNIVFFFFFFERYIYYVLLNDINVCAIDMYYNITIKKMS